MLLERLLKKLNIKESEFEDKFPAFIPYLYLDGHRTSGLANNDSKCYESGIKFFLRFAEVLKEFKCKEMVTMIYTLRNSAVKNRVLTIQNTIIDNLDLNNNILSNTRFFIYGNLDKKEY